MKSFLNGFTGGLGRTFGRILAFIIIALLILIFLKDKKEEIKTNINKDIRDVIQLE